MTPERWRQVTDVFHAALARDTAGRQPFLDQACSGDAALRTKWTRCSPRTRASSQFGESPVGGGVADAESPTRWTLGPVPHRRVDRRRRDGPGLSRARLADWAATSRSKCCRPSMRPTLNASAASNRNPRAPARSIIRTS